MQSLRNRCRRAGGGGNAVPEFHIHIGTGDKFRHAAHILKPRDLRLALLATNRQRPQPPFAHMRHQRGHAIENHIHIAGEQIIQARRQAAIGHVRNLDTRSLHQLGNRQMANGADARRCCADLPWPALRISHKFFKGSPGPIGIHDKQRGADGYAGDMREIPNAIKGHTLVV